MNNLNPLFAWAGGKRREIQYFSKYFPSFISNQHYTYIEPFVGAGAIFWHLNNLSGKNIINDFDYDLINFYNIFRSNNTIFNSTLSQIGQINNRDELKELYLKERNKDKNNGLKNLSDIERAIRFFVINQLAFSGMRRFNKKGENNVAFGNLNSLNTSFINSQDHKNLLDRTDIFHGDFEYIMRNNDNLNTFIFLDPPYTRAFKAYSPDNNFNEEEHIRLFNRIKSSKKSNIMLVIDKSDFTEKLYKGMIIDSYQLKYEFNIRNRFSKIIEHLIITNY